MQFALVALDRPNAVEDRLRIRPDHLKHLDALGESLLLAGPFLNDKGEGIGSIVVIESESLDTARAAFNRDPFVTEGLFDTVLIKPWKLNINRTRV
jgi:uncharacterized protein YciI